MSEADTEHKDGLFLTQQEWDDLAGICWMWLEEYPLDPRQPLLERVIEAAQIEELNGA